MGGDLVLLCWSPPVPDLEVACRGSLFLTLGTLSDQELRDLIRRADGGGAQSLVRAPDSAREDRHPARRAQSRLKKEVGEAESPLHDIDVDKLGEILASKAPPPTRGLDAAGGEIRPLSRVRLSEY